MALLFSRESKCEIEWMRDSGLGVKIMLETIQQAVKTHDKYQIEIKLDYEFHPNKKTRYQVSTYIFIPQSLGVHRHNYARADFYRDIQNYIRLKTPTFILRDFTENPASPLAIIANIIANPNWPYQAEAKARLIDSFKLMRAMLKSSLREHMSHIQKRITAASPKTKINLLINNLVEEFLVETRSIVEKYRSFYPEFNLPNVDPEIFIAYHLTDEAISILIEENSVEIFQIVETYLKKSESADFKHKLCERVTAETNHRKAMGYRSILKDGDENEEFVYRTSVLKKYASSILFLSTDIHREGVGLEQMLYSVAAGLSMVFATVVAFYFQYYYGNFTFPFFVALIVGYMFKDRIKEAGRGLFARYLQNSLYDRRIIIRTLDGQHKLGILREKVSFVREQAIPPGVMAARNRDQITTVANDGQGEYVICYSKDIELYTAAVKKQFVDLPEISGINDIMRYDIRAYLKKMAEPVQEKVYLKNGELKTALCHKVYHLNIVSKYKSIYPKQEEIYKRTRLVLNQEGIKRVEHVPVLVSIDRVGAMS